MTRSEVLVGELTYTVAGLEPRARGDVHQAVVRAQLVDALTGAPVTGRTRVSTAVPGLRPGVAPGGYVGLAGVPSRVLPDLGAAAYEVALQVEAEGYLPWRAVAQFAPQAGFPATFAAAHLGPLPLRRLPVAVRVSTAELDAANRPVPLPGASVDVTGVWETLAELAGPPATPTLLAVAPGASAPRPVGAGVDRPTLGAPPEQPRVLVRAAAPGDTVLWVSRAGGFVPGDLVGVDLGLADRAERVEVVAIDGPADVDSPAWLELRFPLVHAHPESVAATRLSTGAAPPPVTTTRAAVVGDRTLAVGALAGFAPGQVVRISGGAAAAEYRVADLYTATSDGWGFSTLPPLTGYAAAQVTASTAAASGTAAVTLTQPTPSLGLTLT